MIYIKGVDKFRFRLQKIICLYRFLITSFYYKISYLKQKYDKSERSIKNISINKIQKTLKNLFLELYYHLLFLITDISLNASCETEVKFNKEFLLMMDRWQNYVSNYLNWWEYNGTQVLWFNYNNNNNHQTSDEIKHSTDNRNDNYNKINCWFRRMITKQNSTFLNLLINNTTQNP